MDTLVGKLRQSGRRYWTSFDPFYLQGRSLKNFGFNAIQAPKAFIRRKHSQVRYSSGNETCQSPTLPALFQGGARLTNAVHAVWKQFISEGDVVIDATAGNGHDTVALARFVGPKGCVHAFDIQEAAIRSTSSALEVEFSASRNRIPRVELHHRCFTEMKNVCGINVARVIAFNLGYLPGSDKSITTSQDKTCKAIEISLEVLHSGGILSVLSYTGHPGGTEEYAAVKKVLESQSAAEYVSSEIKLLNRPSAPILLVVWKK